VGVAWPPGPFICVSGDDVACVGERLTDPDARLVEDAFARRLAELGSETVENPATSPTAPPAPNGDQQGKVRGVGRGATASLADAVGAPVAISSPGELGSPPAWLGPADPEPFTIPAGVDKSGLAIGAPRRFRDKAHLAFVAAQPCLVCGRRPVDPHHVRFAQGRALGRKVSDEFTVPLCRSHHRVLHRSGSEYLWWENVGIGPLKAARKLWRQTRGKAGGQIRG
jgi:hypothetical protein